YSAGLITISGAAKAVTLTPNGKGLYTAQGFAGTTRLYSGGELLTVSAVGDTVPGFTGTLAAPHVVVLVAPALPAPGTALSIEPTRDLPLAWKPGVPGEKVTLTLTLHVPASSATQKISCVFPASGGQGLVPAAALANLPAGDGTFSVSSGTDLLVQAGS